MARRSDSEPNPVTRLAMIAGAIAVAVATGVLLDDGWWIASGLGWVLALMAFGGFLLAFGPAITIGSAANRDPAVTATTRWVVPIFVAAGTAAGLATESVIPVVAAAALAAAANWWLVDRG